MKTKLTLFVAVIVVALFGMGCASTESAGNQKPAEPKEPAFVKEGLVAYYPFNGNAKDESGNGNNGKSYEARGARVVPSEDRHGVDDGAYHLNGPSSGFDVGEFDFDPINKITVSCWVKLAERNVRKTEKDMGHTDYGIFRGGGSKEDDFHLLIHSERDYIYVRFNHGIHDSTGDGLKSSLPLNKWLHVAMTSNGRKTFFYIDGSSVGKTKAQTPTHSHVKSKGKFYIGVGTPLGNFNGSMDDIRIYNRALSATEIKALYDLEKPKAK